MNAEEFSQLRYGMFIHYGLYSILGRGEWVMNREKMPVPQYEKLAKRFNPKEFDADKICQCAVNSGMRYLVFTTMHHDGFRLYNSKLSSYNSVKVCGRDLTAEIIAAAKKHGLKIGLYHSLNNWHDKPDAVDAFESKDAYNQFIENTFARLEELVQTYKPIDILWYDGWWPFHKDGWQAEKMNAMLRKIQPDLLFNGRNCLPGDFATPEQHLTPPSPWRPWEAAITINDHWGYYRHDKNFKKPIEIVKMLLHCGDDRGNLLLNIGPKPNGAFPKKAVKTLHAVGTWLEQGGSKAIFNNDKMILNPLHQVPGPYCTDWDNNGIFTAAKNHLFFTLLYNPGKKLTFTGISGKVQKVTVKNYGPLTFTQIEDHVLIELPKQVTKCFAPVLDFKFNEAPSIYRTGGMRTPKVEHPRYDPIKPDIQY